MEGRKEGRTEGRKAGRHMAQELRKPHLAMNAQAAHREPARPRYAPTDRAGVRPPRRARPSTWVRIMNWANQELNDGDQR